MAATAVTSSSWSKVCYSHLRLLELDARQFISPAGFRLHPSFSSSALISNFHYSSFSLSPPSSSSPSFCDTFLGSSASFVFHSGAVLSWNVSLSQADGGNWMLADPSTPQPPPSFTSTISCVSAVDQQLGAGRAAPAGRPHATLPRRRAPSFLRCLHIPPDGLSSGAELHRGGGQHAQSKVQFVYG